MGSNPTIDKSSCCAARTCVGGVGVGGGKSSRPQANNNSEGLCHLMVRTSRCGNDNPGSNLGKDTKEICSFLRCCLQCIDSHGIQDSVTEWLKAAAAEDFNRVARQVKRPLL